jgi:predicted transcriptional regulator
MSQQTDPGIHLTPTQQLILQELVACYRESETPVKGEAIAGGVDRTPGTVRNQMQSLKALQLVEGIPGPQGGYKPTPRAFDVLSLQDVGEPAEAPLVRNGNPIEGAVIEEIGLRSVLHPEQCRAEIQLQGVATDRFAEADAVSAGPTPVQDLRIDGVVEGVDDVHNTLVVDVESMGAPADPP